MPRRGRLPTEEPDDTPLPTRSLRNRHPPDRFVSSSHSAISSRKTRTTRASSETTPTHSGIDWTTRLVDCEREEDFVSNYSYDHVGQALESNSPDVWVEVPQLDLEDTLPSAVIIKECLPSLKKVQFQHDEDTGSASDSVQVLVDLPEEILAPSLTQDKSDASESIVVEVDVPEEDQAPTQDSTAPHEEIAPWDLQSINSPIEDFAQDQDPTSIDLTEVVHTASVDTIAHSTSSMEVAASLFDKKMGTVDTARLSAPLYHPETRLSHGEDEVVGSRSSIIPRSVSLPRRSKDAEIIGRPLFLGSDDDVDDQGEHHLQAKSLSTGLKSKLPVKQKPMESTLKQTNEKGANSSKKVAEAASLSRQSVSVRSQIEAEAGPSRLKLTSQSEEHQRQVAADLEGRRKRKRKSLVEKGKVAKESKKGSKKEAKKRLREDLAQDLNIDAVAHLTSSRLLNARRAEGLKRLAKEKRKSERRRQGELSSSSESCSSSESDDSSESDSEDSDVGAFVVDDEETSRAVVSKGSHQVGTRRRSPGPPSLVSKDYLSNVRSLPRREKLQEYLRWVVGLARGMKPPSEERERQLIAVRTNLREHFKMEFKTLTTQANRRQFAWYLRHYPYFERRPMTKEEKEQFRGCAACHRVSQKCEYAYSCWGYLYDLNTLTKMSDSDHSSSDLSTNAEDYKQSSLNSKKEKVYTFYLGDACAKYASVKHKLFHWERRVLNDVVKLPSYKAVKNKVIDGDDIEDIVGAYYSKLSERLARLESDARTLLTNPDRYHRLRDRWDDDP